jgi:WD40 repeat protein
MADHVLGIDTGKGDSAQYTAFSYDATNDQLITATVGTLKFFDAADGHKLKEVDFGSGGYDVAVGRAGGTTAAIDGENAWIFDDAGSLLRTISLPPTVSAALAPDGTSVATGDAGGHIHLYRTGTGAEIRSLASAESVGASIYSVAFSPDGTYLAASSLFGNRLWNVADASLVTDIPGSASPMAISSTGELAIDGAGVLEIFAIPDGTRLASYPISSAQPRIAYSSDGTLLAVGPEPVWPDDSPARIIDRAGGESVKLFDDPQTRPPQIGSKPRYVVGLAFAGPDRVAVAWSDGRLAAFRVTDGTRVWSRVDSD